MMKRVLLLWVCSGCVLNTNAPTEVSLIDDGAVRVEPLRLTLDDGVETRVLEDLTFDLPGPFETGRERLTFDFAGHRLSLEASQAGNMAAAGGEVGLRIDGRYHVATLSRRSGSPPLTGHRIEILELDFALDGRVVHATLELDADYHCPPYPTEPATAERSGPPALEGAPL